MNKGIKTTIYPTKDAAKSKEMFSKFLGVEPYVDSPYYIGFRIGDQEVGINPNGHEYGTTNYYDVDDIRQSLQTLTDAGATVIQDVKDVGQGKLIAVVKDTDGNIIGLSQKP